MQENSEFDNLIYEAEKQCERRNADALKLIERARQIADSSGQMVQLALLSYIEAYYDIFVSNNYDRAINSCQQALSNLDEESYQAVGYKLLMTLGNSYHKKGDQFSAQDSYLKGLKSLQLKPALSLKEEKFLAGFYYNLSILLSSHELNPEAEGYLQKAIEMYLKQDNKFKLSKCYSAYAQIFELKENYLQAIDYLNQALAIDEEIKDAYSIALSKANLGILSVKINDYEKSFLYLKDALEFYEKNSMVFESGVLKYNLGNAY
ncbi:MAG: hypothetical protein JWO06_753, partial [Bacteroidota bacterium]|nr:hypothetical protein [Bacteroidota bacterium]